MQITIVPLGMAESRALDAPGGPKPDLEQEGRAQGVTLLHQVLLGTPKAGSATRKMGKEGPKRLFWAFPRARTQTQQIFGHVGVTNLL